MDRNSLFVICFLICIKDLKYFIQLVCFVFSPPILLVIFLAMDQFREILGIPKAKQFSNLDFKKS
ncbi:MAG TPA: hypothetical protein DHU93_00165 [Algoriphagus sp.]|jgi:hypothetical protein|nr:hypothetical protein [Algoriphagus sp.]HCH43666.1 hypothetical protein [Algoriphagus sp.]HCX74081.1 hypothetical protein [Algoriphagus sp.]